ncbi:hypothetical protein VTK73DRAFT_4632 [Phialemonium thermophilum]|uniref:Uncharacterized protein n=1 Tax=Phialemonium thermophilum TaxID=223376 RepID=A0ABR3WT08_9PEZI
MTAPQWAPTFSAIIGDSKCANEWIWRGFGCRRSGTTSYFFPHFETQYCTKSVFYGHHAHHCALGGTGCAAFLVLVLAHLLYHSLLRASAWVSSVLEAYSELSICFRTAALVMEPKSPPDGVAVVLLRGFKAELRLVLWMSPFCGHLHFANPEAQKMAMAWGYRCRTHKWATTVFIPTDS